MIDPLGRAIHNPKIKSDYNPNKVCYTRTIPDFCFHFAGIFQPAESAKRTWLDDILGRSCCFDSYPGIFTYSLPDGEPDEPKGMKGNEKNYDRCNYGPDYSRRSYHIHFLSAMTDPTPPQVKAGWYLPQQDIVWTSSGPDLTSSTQERLILAGHRYASAPHFPSLSPFSRYENYTHHNTNNSYMITARYFNDDRKFLKSQKNLFVFWKPQEKSHPLN